MMIGLTVCIVIGCKGRACKRRSKMKAKLIVEGKEFDIEILAPKLQELIVPKKKTGYERVEKEGVYFWDDSIGVNETSVGWECDKEMYDTANYYSNQDVAENNARADKLMRQLRRFAVEHRNKELDWNNYDQRKFYIGYDCKRKVFDVECNTDYITSHTVYFDSYESAEDAISVFSSELKWYFTEYKDSL